ncbi:hypothetical protein [Streptomyces sp. NPDC058766]|uniref:hypothetical protein n=1 Tax=Streptomyces sp. NPDC058766 TaxID=3346630 RepID=UPI0036A3ABD5
MGRQDHEGLPPGELDHAVRPWDIGDGTAAVVGGPAVVLAGVGAAVLVRGALRGTWDQRWWGVLGPLVVLGLMAGVGWRIVTAGTVGANIGAGLVIILGTPIAAGILLWSVAWGVWLAWHGRRAGGEVGGGGSGVLDSRGV